MFYFMSKGDFLKVAVVVETINAKGYLLPSKDCDKIMGWINNGKNEYFDQFCIAVAEEWDENFSKASLDNYEVVACIIHNLLKEW